MRDESAYARVMAERIRILENDLRNAIAVAEKASKALSEQYQRLSPHGRDEARAVQHALRSLPPSPTLSNL